MSNFNKCKYVLFEAQELAWNGRRATRAFFNGRVVWAKPKPRLRLSTTKLILDKNNNFTADVNVYCNTDFEIREIE